MSAELTNIKLLGKISQGAFGEICECMDVITGNRLAIKIEKKACVLQLKHEFAVYKIWLVPIPQRYTSMERSSSMHPIPIV